MKTAAERLRLMVSRGNTSTVGPPVMHADEALGEHREDSEDDFNFSAHSSAKPGTASVLTPALNLAPEAVIKPGPPRPGVFTSQPTLPPVVLNPDASLPGSSAPQRLSAAQRLSAQVGSKDKIRELSCMKMLTRILEAVYARPGSSASDEERMQALVTLSTHSMELGDVVAHVAGDDVNRSAYVRAMSMDAAVGLACSAWTQNRDINWPSLIRASAETPVIAEAANTLGQALYRPTKTANEASDRLAISMHAALWQLVAMGDRVDGMKPSLAAEIVRDCADYLNQRERFVEDSDLQLSWMQGSIRRLTDLVCAELGARFGGKGISPSDSEIKSVLDVCRSGFEGVENYAQCILERPGASPVPVYRPVGA